MSDVANAAGVAVQTVYFMFHTKAELLSSAVDFAVLGEDEPTTPEMAPWYAQMTAEPNVTDALRHAVAGIGTILARATPLDAVVRWSAGSDPELARIRARHEGWRAAGYRVMLEILQQKAALRDGVSPERATQLLLMYIGDVYRILVYDFGWSHEEWIDWTVDTVSEQVFGLDAVDRGGRTSG